MFARWKQKMVARVQRVRVWFPFHSFSSLKAAYRFAQINEIVRILRGRHGCPWDQKQTLQDILPFLQEEALETWLAGQEALAGDFPHFAEEMGDLIFVILFLARLCEEQKECDISDSLSSIVLKMLRRHPHVFSDASRDPVSIKKTWQAIKAEERRIQREERQKKGLPVKDPAFSSILDGIEEDWSALRVALRISKKVVSVGFEWPNAWDVWKKLEEEIEELKAEMPPYGKEENHQNRQRQQEELGDILFTLVNLGRHLGIDCERALREQCSRFTKRFQYIETQLQQQGKKLEETPLERLEALWQEAKKVNV